MKYRFQEKEPRCHETAFIAPSASVIGDVILEDSSSVWFNAVLRGDNDLIEIGKESNIQDGTVVHVDAGFPVRVGEGVTIGHNVTLHGCTIGNGALIGMGAVILNGAVIEKGALVAAGALVPEGKIIQSRKLAAGVPAKQIRNLSEENTNRAKAGVQEYIELGKKYNVGLQESECKGK
ncbi:gamma carbonic anhydrase family protein [Salibacterium aidingense]|uniref:gamma carbonic anhydrase family protein n=1 Tax=Salibacterium aidingense TaxID=384933 RepID=UPI003BCCAFBC